MQQPETKPCLSCGKPLRGRADKKFCDDYCRNTFNNNLKSGSNNLVKNINNALSKNRRILENVLGDQDEICKISREKLLELGFKFRYLTHTYKNKKGNIYFFCYDHGYLPIDNNLFLVVKSREE